MSHAIIHSGHTMEKFGFFGFVSTWLSYIFSYIVNEKTLQEISLVLAIIVSVLTILWYMGKMIQGRKEMWRHLKEMFGRKK
jgi:hypothetical protein